MNYLDEPCFDKLFVDFSAARLCEPNTIWMGKRFFVEDVGRDESRRRFESRFSYMIPDSECFDRLTFDRSQSRLLKAERYGGEGAADNGGGVRCGNIDEFQIKGIGKNPLAGAGHDPLHSYGGLSAIDAIYETICANTVGRILPIGVANIHGLILTGPQAAYNLGHVKGERGWGAIMVRDCALRPAHFLRAGHFKPASDVQPSIAPDVARVRYVNRQVAKRFSNTADFVRFIGNFLAACANQFAFARLACITHGSLGAGNICFDGRWIDLTNTGFIRSDQNTAGFLPHLPSFYDELRAPLRIIQEVIDTYNKYNRTNIGTGHLAVYYEEQLQAYFSMHVGYVLGVDRTLLDRAEYDESLEVVKAAVLDILSSGATVRNAWPLSLSDTDPILGFIENVFLAMIDRPSGRAALAASAPQACDVDTLIDSCKTLLTAAGSTFAGSKSGGGLVACFLTAFKRAAWPGYYFKERMERTTRTVLATNDMSHIRDFVEQSIILSDWIFEEVNGDAVVLLRLRGIAIEFDLTSGCYRLTGFKKRGTDVFARAAELLMHVDDDVSEQWILHGYDFRPLLKRALSFAAKLEGTQGKRDD